MAESEKIDATMRSLEITDLKMARIVEDLIRILVQRGIIKYSDLSDASRQNLREREALREELRVLLKNR